VSLSYALNHQLRQQEPASLNHVLKLELALLTRGSKHELKTGPKLEPIRAFDDPRPRE
jgi:hypothetical protein